MKTDVEYLEFMWPMRHYLVTCGDRENESNIIAVSFCMPVSKDPPLVACAIGVGAYSCKLIKSNNEFVVNVPSNDLEPELYYCGLHSGRHVDKFKETRLTPQPALKVRAPIIGECAAHMECKLKKDGSPEVMAEILRLNIQIINWASAIYPFTNGSVWIQKRVRLL